MDKWLSKDEKNKKPTREFTEEEIEEGKKRKIQELTGKKKPAKKPQKKSPEKSEPDDFLSYVIEFKDWLNKRPLLPRRLAGPVSPKGRVEDPDVCRSSWQVPGRWRGGHIVSPWNRGLVGGCEDTPCV